MERSLSLSLFLSLTHSSCRTACVAVLVDAKQIYEWTAASVVQLFVSVVHMCSRRHAISSSSQPSNQPPFARNSEYLFSLLLTFSDISCGFRTLCAFDFTIHDSISSNIIQRFVWQQCDKGVVHHHPSFNQFEFFFFIKTNLPTVNQLKPELIKINGQRALLRFQSCAWQRKSVIRSPKSEWCRWCERSNWSPWHIAVFLCVCDTDAEWGVFVAADDDNDDDDDELI